MVWNLLKFIENIINDDIEMSITSFITEFYLWEKKLYKLAGLIRNHKTFLRRFVIVIKEGHSIDLWGPLAAEMGTLLKLWRGDLLRVKKWPLDRRTICYRAKSTFDKLKGESADEKRIQTLVTSNG